MKKLIALFFLLTLLLPGAALAEFDVDGLYEREPNVIEMMTDSWDTVYSLSNPLYMGEIDNGMMIVSLDYVSKPQLQATLIRVDVVLMLEEPLNADTVVFTVGGKRYAFTLEADTYEYDGTYQEEFAICLTDASLPFLKAVAQQKKDDPIPVAFLSMGEVVLEGSVVLPGSDAAHIYDLYIDLGGKTQDLKSLDEEWPCEITKAK